MSFGDAHELPSGVPLGVQGIPHAIPPGVFLGVSPEITPGLSIMCFNDVRVFVQKLCLE